MPFFKSKVGVYILLLFSVAIWGMSFVWTGQLLNVGFPVLSIVFLRLLMASLLLLAITPGLRKLQRIKKEDVTVFFLLALFEPFLYFIGETYGIVKTSPTVASVVVSTIPLFSPIAAFYFYRERITIRNFIGIAISIGGVCLVIFHQGIDTNLHIDGILLLALATASAVFYSAVIRKLASKYNALTIVTYQNMIGALYFLPLFLFVDYNDLRLLSFGWQELYPLSMLAILASGVAFVFFVNAIGVLGMTRANMFTTLIPVLTAIFAFMVGLEMLTPLRVAGIVVVVAGLVLSQLAPSVKKMTSRTNKLL